MTGYVVDGARVGQARQALTNGDGKPLKQVEAAELLGVHPVTLNRIENGKARVSLDLLERMTVVLGRSREWLLGEPEQLDEITLARQQFGVVLRKLESGFADMSDLIETLTGQAREATQKVAR